MMTLGKYTSLSIVYNLSNEFHKSDLEIFYSENRQSVGVESWGQKSFVTVFNE